MTPENKNFNITEESNVWTGGVPSKDFYFQRINHEFIYGRTANGSLEIMSSGTHSVFGVGEGQKYVLESDGKYHRVENV